MCLFEFDISCLVASNSFSMLWIVSIISASTTWSVSEIFSDVCIDDGESEDEIPSKVHSGKLTGEQATFVSGATMLLCALLLNFIVPNGTWNPDNAGWWIALLSGFLNAIAAFMLYKAYETAPSTIIVPLVQLTAVMMLITSTVVSLIAPYFPSVLASQTNNYITLREGLAYIIILIGGLYPATNGNIQLFLKRDFWKQPYVLFILINDFLLALLYEMIEIATSETHNISPEQYVIVSSYTTVFSYIILFTFVERMRHEVIGLRHVHRRNIQLCMAAEVLNWVAYWIATYAYQSHQANVNIVNAAEVALNQVMNLVTALAMKLLLGVGRDNAIEDLPVKLASCVCVSVGIVLSTIAPVGHRSLPRALQVTPPPLAAGRHAARLTAIPSLAPG